ncbi:MAG: hypothetical protein ACHQ4F_11845 [Candidatus Dormibacteria bacterium]
MPKLVMTHAVADIERWLKGKDERAAAIGSVGTNVTDHVAADGSNNVAITADVQDVEAAQAMVTSPSPETVALMQSHGVIPPVTTYIER